VVRESPFPAVSFLAAVVLAGVVLTACESLYPSGYANGEAAPPPPDSGLPAASAPPPADAAREAVPSETVPDSGTADQEKVVVTDSEGNIVEEQAPDAEYQAAVDACYRFAQGRIAHDIRMESDARASLDQYSEGLGLTELRGRMQDYERTGRLRELFERCMRDRGYASD
jgi:hypothetical protein